MAENFVFTVDSALLGELGERLVTSVHIALAELVKNAYDADARRVSIDIDYQDGMPAVTVSDNGSGMTLDEVRRYWMKIGTTNKVKEAVSPLYGRARTGAKGIGRFACRRLGTKLTLKTCAKLKGSKRGDSNAYETTEIEFDWLDFKPGKDVAEVPCTGRSRRHTDGETGTTLRISGADEDEWRQRGFDYLRRQLAVLVSNQGSRRAGYKEDPGFTIEFDAPGFKGGLGDLREQVIGAGWATLEAKVDSSGRAVCELWAKRIGHRKIRSSQKFPLLSGARLRLGILPNNRREDFRKPSVLSKRNAREITDEWGGVQVRYNGFRVYPYGDPNDDWLHIERDRARRVGRPDTASDEHDDDANGSGDELFTFAKGLGKIDPGRVMLNLLSSKSFLGSVEVGSKAIRLQPKADRLGFVDNDAFVQLVAFTRFAIDWATIWRDFYIQTGQEEATEEAREELSTVLGKNVGTEQVANKAVEFLEAKFNQLVTLIPDVREQKETRRIVHQTTKALQTSVASDKEKLRRLRLIASASTLTLLFSHEIKSLLGTLDSATRTLRKIAGEVAPEKKPWVIELATDIEHAKDRFKDLVELTALVGAVGQQAEATDLNLQQHLVRAVRCFDLIIRDYRLDIDTSGVPKSVMVGPLVPGELYAVLLNVLSNAIKSVIASGKKRSIAFTARTEGKHAILAVRDTGLGLAEEQYETVFASFVSDPEGRLYDRLEKNLNPQDLLIFGQGSGLGLSIVRDILESRGGGAKFIAPEPGWSASLELTLP